MGDVISRNEQNRARILNIIDKVLEEHRIRKAHENSTYYDEPIVKTASQLNNYTPEKITQMRQLVKLKSVSPQELFYRQGIFMADFNDNYDRDTIDDSIIYRYPTYQSMRDRELRRYFTWRSKVRSSGSITVDVPSFLFLYVYEILNLIGYDNPKQAFDAYIKIYDICRSGSGMIQPYLDIWYRDFIVYYDLDKGLLDRLTEFKKFNNFQILCQPQNYTDTELFASLISIGEYNINKSAFYRKHTEDLIHSICCSYRALAQEYRKVNKSILTELFGNKIQQSFFLFSGAVFFDQKRVKDYEYHVNEAYDIGCKHGRWYVSYYDMGQGKKKIGNFIKYTEYMMRMSYNFNNFREVPCLPEEYKLAISEGIQQHHNYRKKLLIPEINIDISKLSNIRKSADITMHKLIIEEVAEEEICADPIMQNNTLADMSAGEEWTLLDVIEKRFLRLLLENKPYVGYIRENKIILSVMIDSINEKLFEEFQDTVILSDGDSPVIIEDYIENLKGFVYK